MARIAVVDDDVEVRRLIRHILEEEGYVVDELLDSRDDQKDGAAARADLIILPLHAERRDGLSMLRRLRANGRRIKVIVTGGECSLCQKDFLPVAQRLGADATLYQPIAREELLQTVSSLLATASDEDTENLFQV